MPSQYTQRHFEKNGYYHVYNRGAHKREIFFGRNDYQTFIDILFYYLTYPNGKPYSEFNNNQEKISLILAEPSRQHLIAYCLMPNHYHLLFRQVYHPSKQTGISNLMQRLSVAYVMYFNKKYNHSGGLFQGKFKNVAVKSDGQLLHLTRYIHLNPDFANYRTYPYSSYRYYLSAKKSPYWLHPETALAYFTKNFSNSYSSFTGGSDPQKLSANLMLD